jgi:CHAD domain-containing protein
MTVTLEREAKLGAEPAFSLPDLDGVVTGIRTGRVEVAALEATYYDTPDLRLARSGITLRYRVEPGGGRWTLKLPSGEGTGQDLSRTELEFPGDPDRIPEALADLVQVHVRRAGLVPVAKIRTDRRRVVLVDNEGRELAEVDDDAVTAHQGAEQTSAFREIEVELRADAPRRLLPTLVRALQAAGAAKGPGLPKAVRVLGREALGPPEVEVAPLPRRPAAGDVVRRAIAAGTDRLVRHDPGTRLGADPEDLHQARVATRRLRSDLRTFRPLLDPGWVATTRDELRFVAGALGAVRDRDVLLVRLRQRVARLDADDAAAAEGLLAAMESERAEAREALLAVLRSSRYLDLVEALVQAARRPPLTEEARRPAKAVIPRLARKPWKRLSGTVGALPRQPSDVELHRVRVMAKRCRYAAEAVAPVVGRAAGRFAAAVADLQTVLGDLHDSVVAQEWLRTAARGAPPTRALVAGELLAAERADAEALRARWRGVWRTASRRKLRSWMR